MKDPNEYIDDVVKNGQQSQFEYKESYWEEMASILDANDNRRRNRALLLWASSASMVVLLAIASWFFIADNNMIYQSRDHQGVASLSSSNFDLLIADYENAFASIQYQQFQDGDMVKGATGQSTAGQQTAGNNVLLADHKIGNVVGPEQYEEDKAQPHLKVLQTKFPQIIENNVEQNLVTKTFDLEHTLDPQDRNIERHQVSLLGGASIGGFSGASGVNGVDYVAAVSYAYKLNPKWSIGAGIQYSRKSMNFRKEQTFSQYSFKRTDEKLGVSYDQLHYAQLPIQLNFHQERHTVSAQIVPSYAFGVATSYQRERFNHELDAFESVAEVKNNYGVTEGIQPFDLQIGVGYSYALTSFIDIGANVSLGTFDVTDNQYWKNEAKDLNIDARAYLKFNLF